MYVDSHNMAKAQRLLFGRIDEREAKYFVPEYVDLEGDRWYC